MHRYRNTGDAAIAGAARGTKTPKKRLTSYPMEMTSKKEPEQNLNWWLLLKESLKIKRQGLLMMPEKRKITDRENIRDYCV
jgi:hypothetical protein